MQTIIVNTLGPQGPKGDTGPQGPSGSLQPSNSGSFNITGSLDISGSLSASSFSGDGSGLTNLNIPSPNGSNLYLFYNY
jgi:hypothetical protein